MHLPQGREKEICIFTTVRSNQRRQLGFVTDPRRINVGLSRARSSLLVGCSFFFKSQSVSFLTD